MSCACHPKPESQDDFERCDECFDPEHCEVARGCLIEDLDLKEE